MCNKYISVGAVRIDVQPAKATVFDIETEVKEWLKFAAERDVFGGTRWRKKRRKNGRQRRLSQEMQPVN